MSGFTRELPRLLRSGFSLTILAAVLSLRLVIFAALFGIALWGLFSLLDNLREPELLRSAKAVVVKGCDPIESDEAQQLCPQLFCQKFLLDARVLPLRSRVQRDGRHASAGNEQLIGGVVQTGAADSDQRFACILRRQQGRRRQMRRWRASRSARGTACELVARRSERPMSIACCDAAIACARSSDRTAISISPTDVEPFLVDHRRLYRGATPLVLRPDSTEQVAAIMTLCNDARRRRRAGRRQHQLLRRRHAERGRLADRAVAGAHAAHPHARSARTTR